MAGRFGGMPPGQPPYRPGARPSASPGPQSNGTSPSPSTKSKAEQFADDKRRIQQSCFSKTDVDGSPPESYITHIRVTEDARYPQAPPPPNSDRNNKKERVIILAVRTTGRVRLHKARENANGSFSIGKTWNFEELSAIQSFTDFRPRAAEEANWPQWAGENGFMVTLGKPYFWQTSSVNEKSYFIASLVKVYERYTNGKLPELIGFSQREYEDVMSQVKPPQSRAPAVQPDVPGRVRSPFGANTPGQRPGMSPESTYTYAQSSPVPGGPPPLSARRGGMLGQESRPPPAMSPDSLRPAGLRQATSREQIRPYTASSSASSPPPRVTPQASAVDLGIMRNGTPDSVSTGSNRRGGAIFQGLPNATTSREALNPNGLGISDKETDSLRSTLDRFGTNGSSSQVSLAAPSNVPERRRPPLGSPDISDFAAGSNAAIPRPLQPSGSGPDRTLVGTPPPVEVPPKSPERMASRKISISEKMDGTKAKEISPADMEKPAEDEPEGAEPPAALVVPDEARPGLGRMFGGNKKTTRELFSKAATAYSVFKPRAGGAAAKLLAAENKIEGPDGITGVVPAPGLIRSKTDESLKTPTTESMDKLSPFGNKPDLKPTKSASEVATLKSGAMPTPQQIKDLQQKAADLQNKSKAEEEEAARRKVRRTPQQLKYLERLGVDPAQLEGRGLEYESLLDEFWPQKSWHNKAIDVLQADIRRELSRAQTGSWFEHIASHDADRQAAILLIDDTIEECEALEKLLTIYSVELGGLTDDIAYIEAQGQGLQVQTANQKLLATELQALIESIEISEEILDPIFNANVMSIEGLESAERAIVALYKALVLIDPSICLNKPTSDLPAEYEQLSKMRALKEKNNRYRDASASFLSRFKNYMDIVYGQTALEIESLSLNDVMRTGASGTLTIGHVNSGRAPMWRYSPLVLFAKSLDQSAWRALISGYEAKMKTLYSTSIGSTFSTCRKVAKPPGDDEALLLFTMSEMQAESLSVGQRKSMVRRNQTLSRGFRAVSGDAGSRITSGQSAGIYPHEAFKNALNEIAPILHGEQLFIIDFFHTTTTETMDFAEAVELTLPENRIGPMDLGRKQHEPDANMMQLVSGAMSAIFTSLPKDLQDLVDWANVFGPLQVIGIIYALHKVMAEVSDGFFFRTLHALATKLSNDWSRFISAQVRAIEDTKVKIKKRKGVIYFIKVFPSFAAHLENMLLPSAEDSSDARLLVDQGFQQLNKAMFESLRAIAKESPSTASHAPSSDPEDKEALNYHILLIENMNHYVEYVDDRGNVILVLGRQKAKEELDEHLSLYVDAIIRRPLGKLMDYSESLTHAIDDIGGAPVSSLASKPTFSASTYRKIVSSYDGKEVRRGIESLRKRIDKHFGDVDDPEISRNLIQKVIGAAEDRFALEIDNLQASARLVYGDDFVPIAVSRDEISKWFRGAR